MPSGSCPCKDKVPLGKRDLQESQDVSTAGTLTASPTTGPPFPIPPTIRPEHTLSRGQWGVLSFLVSEVALFGTLIVTYIFYLGRDTVGPTPAGALRLSLVVWTTACLLASSATVHVAERTLGRGDQRGFILWWLATIVLGLALGRQVTSANRAGVVLVSWYWHFVDGVWVVVFTVVYLVGR